MILSGEKIKAQCSLGNKDDLICPFQESECLRLSSYDLTVGDEYYIEQDGATLSVVTQKLEDRQSFSIPPHAVCFIVSKEHINLPHDLTARVSLRMSHVYAGLVLTSQPPFDPGYEGRVIVMLHNLSSRAYALRSGDRLATIEFAQLESQAQGNVKPHRSVTTLQGQLGAPVRSSLVEIDKVSREALGRVSWLSNQMLTFAALIVAVLAVPGYFSYSSLQENYKDQKDAVGKLEELIKRQEHELMDLRLQVKKLDRTKEK